MSALQQLIVSVISQFGLVPCLLVLAGMGVAGLALALAFDDSRDESQMWNLRF